jgi:hypothetical protein
LWYNHASAQQAVFYLTNFEMNMEKMFDLYKDPQFRAFEEIFLDDCREACSIKTDIETFTCSRELARVKLEEIFRSTKNSAINEVNSAAEESYPRSHRNEVVGVAIAALGIPVAVAVGNIVNDPRVPAGVMALFCLVGTAVCAATKFASTADADKKISLLISKKLQTIMDRPDEYFGRVKPEECVI